HDLHRVVVLRDATEQVMQAVPLPGDEDDDLLQVRRVPQTPLRLRTELLRHRTELLPQLIDAHADGIRTDRLTGEEPVVLRVREVGGLGDPTTLLSQERRQLRDDTGRVRTTEGEDVLPLRRLCTRAVAGIIDVLRGHSSNISPPCKD